MFCASEGNVMIVENFGYSLVQMASAGTEMCRSVPNFFHALR